MSKFVLKDNKFTNVRCFGRDVIMNYLNTIPKRVIAACKIAENGLDYEIWMYPEQDKIKNIEEMFNIYTFGIIEEFEIYEKGSYVRIPINWMDIDGILTFTNIGEDKIDVDVSFTNNGDE